MTASAGAASEHLTPLTWSNIDWDKVQSDVKRLQMRIAKAFKLGKFNKAKVLQRLLTRSYSAKLLAVRRVTQNKGKETPGIDGVIWKTALEKLIAANSLMRRGYQPLPLRRIYIPKKNGEKRPLGIPTMKDRAHQAIHLVALEPISEQLADQDSYGFRPHRSCADALEQIFICLAKRNSPQWILEGDIKSCFDKIEHNWLLKNVPMERNVLRKWLKSGFMEKGILHPTQEGTPQGGIISPTLLNVTLSGLQKVIAKSVSKTEKVNLIVYADDFIVTGCSKEVLTTKVFPAIVEFLKIRGLALSQEKTKFTHIEDGFDFLGCNVRKYRNKLLIKPSKVSITSFCRKIRAEVRRMPTKKTDDVIRMLNPKLMGWANYYRHHVSKETYSKVDAEVFKAIWKWCKRRHAKKSGTWLRKKYFRKRGLKQWQFSTRVQDSNGKLTDFDLYSLSDTKIQRHIKIKKAAHPYDPAFNEYFAKRKYNKCIIDQQKHMKRCEHLGF